MPPTTTNLTLNDGQVQTSVKVGSGRVGVGGVGGGGGGGGV
jgi:hypothetical protein